MYQLMDEYFMTPKILQKRVKLYVISLETSGKQQQQNTFFLFIATQREMHQSKKAQCKNLVQAIH